MRKFTTQEVINMGAELYEEKGFSREQIKFWLNALVNSDLADIDIERMFDIIVG